MSNQLGAHKVQARGIYKEGQVHLLEPVDIFGPCPVSVIFETELADVESEVSQTAVALEGIVGLLNDLTSEQQRLFDEAVQRRGPFFGERLSSSRFRSANVTFPYHCEEPKPRAKRGGRRRSNPRR